ncbi:MAG: bifunctional 5,10-methylenetetrahydrofolate dehydrogenase/5,10-methenyltetrahydrofolate cyclohydrolase [Candidatus Cyclobacteriaceae bacterium M2_1C_046]
MQILDGRKIANEIKSELAEEVQKIKERGHKVPHLAAILVGDDAASQTYVTNKINDCKKVGFEYTLLNLPPTISQQKLLSEIERLNNDEDIDGLIVQLPLPEHIDSELITEKILPDKDVDGFTNKNFGKIISKDPLILPATPLGILELLKRYNIETKGAHCVVVGNSRIVGSPMSMLMSYHGFATVTNCHIHTKDLKEHTKKADILIVAVGKPNLITADMVKEGAVVVDVGISRVSDASSAKGFRLRGDVDFDEVAEKCSYITPVPGGVGPMTRASLLMNTLRSAKKHGK